MISRQMDRLQACPALTLVSAFLPFSCRVTRWRIMFHTGARAGNFPENVGISENRASHVSGLSSEPSLTHDEEL